MRLWCFAWGVRFCGHARDNIFPLHISLTSFAAGVGQSAGAPPLNLVVAKGSRLEVHLVSPHGLSLLLDLPIFGTITALQVHS